MASISCPVCSASLTPSSLEPHLRFELLLPAFRCLLCPQSFCSEADALGHFRGEASRHPGHQPRLIQPPVEEAQKERLTELMRLVRGGAEAVEKRLCLCGQCKLLCREVEDSMTVSISQSIYSSIEAIGKERQLTQQLATPASPASAAEVGQDDGLPVEVEEEMKDPRERLVEEASEGENPRPADIKPTQAELKPVVVTDGKVACLQCGKRMTPNSFNQHVRTTHIPGKALQCLLCSFNANLKGNLAKHQKRRHGMAISAETYESTLGKEVLQKWLELCFGDMKTYAYPETFCRPCGKPVRNYDIKRHIALVHLKKPLHECKICNRKVEAFCPNSLKHHVRMVHKLQPGPETIDSSGLRQYSPIIDAMIPQLFEQ